MSSREMLIRHVSRWTILFEPLKCMHLLYLTTYKGQGPCIQCATLVYLCIRMKMLVVRWNLNEMHLFQESQASYIPNWLEYHRKPVTMILRLYSSIILVWDFCIILVFFTMQMLRSLYQMIRLPKRKSVAGEIVAVSVRGEGEALDHPNGDSLNQFHPADIRHQSWRGTWLGDSAGRIGCQGGLCWYQLHGKRHASEVHQRQWLHCPCIRMWSDEQERHHPDDECHREAVRSHHHVLPLLWSSQSKVTRHRTTANSDHAESECHLTLLGTY